MKFKVCITKRSGDVLERHFRCRNFNELLAEASIWVGGLEFYQAQITYISIFTVFDGES
jgi:hypothetical protein